MKKTIMITSMLIGLISCGDDNRTLEPIKDNGKIIYSSPLWSITEVKINDSLTVLVAKCSEGISIIKE